jgi:hypothetical protein
MRLITKSEIKNYKPMAILPKFNIRLTFIGQAISACVYCPTCLNSSEVSQLPEFVHMLGLYMPG